MKQQIQFSLILLLLLPFIMGCSGSKSLKYDAMYTARLGLATTRDFFDNSIPILTRYNFLIEKSEEYGNSFHIETRWRVTPPLDDEAEIGVLQSRSRLILRAKGRQVTSRSEISARLNQVVFTAESEVKFDETESWLKIPLSDMRKEFFKRISEELKFEFSSGFRVK